MASKVDQLLDQLQSLSTDEMHRLRQAIDEQLAQSRTAVAPNGRQRLEALNQLRKDLAALPVRNPEDGFSNRDHDKLVYGGDR